MKKFLAAACGLLLACSLTACGGGGRLTADDAALYVKGLLDETYLGVFDPGYLALVDLTREEAEETYRQGLEVSYQYLSKNFQFDDTYVTDETRREAVDLLAEIYSHARYEVGEPVKTGEGFTLEVTVQPIDLIPLVVEKYMEEYIIVCLGGRVAEQLTMEDISTGAYGDIKQATQMARAMVTSYGMSERIGPIDYGSDNGEVFLGRDLAAGKGYSEVKAAEIDDEIHRIIEHAYHACEKLLSEHMDEMKRVAEYLIRNETMDGETFVKVYNGEIVPDKIVGEDLMTELQQELHAKVSKPAESAEELAKVEEAEKDLDPDKQDQ